MDIDGREGVYLFQGTNLVVPADTPDSAICEEIPPEKVRASLEGGDVFEIPAVHGGGNIKAMVLEPGFSLSPAWKIIPMRQALSQMTGGNTVDGTGKAGRILRSFHIAQWRQESVFCGSCGSRNKDAPAELARQCPVCGRLEFPRISPAIIVIIINDAGEALLAHNKKFAPGIYSLIAGFNEAGENLEATVAREIREEVSLEVRDIRYVASQPWPFPNSLMLGFTARSAGGEIIPDGVEIEDARWFAPDSLPKIPGHGSVSRYLINNWLEGRL
ncbi:MAG: NAD(+) diphosphatase [Treponema sp.]|nr:NAD(+) diphosphatase [Treponema sp.]